MINAPKIAANWLASYWALLRPIDFLWIKIPGWLLMQYLANWTIKDKNVWQLIFWINSGLVHKCMVWIQHMLGCLLKGYYNSFIIILSTSNHVAFSPTQLLWNVIKLKKFNPFSYRRCHYIVQGVGDYQLLFQLQFS